MTPSPEPAGTTALPVRPVNVAREAQPQGQQGQTVVVGGDQQLPQDQDWARPVTCKATEVMGPCVPMLGP